VDRGDGVKKATIFNIQKFCIHDGPGIRTTVFFKGCPLTCLWCHNPESQTFGKEMLFVAHKCVQCYQCERHCGHGALQRIATKITYHSAACVFCGTCVDYCVNNAREVAGQEYSVSELIEEIEKDRPFYEQSMGGVTLSGGEVMCQIDFVEELVKGCHRKGISVAIDTCGYTPFDSFVRIMEYVDLFLYDVKLMDPILHRRYTGKDNSLILENLQQLVSLGAKVNLRIPLIEGINTDTDNIDMMINFTKHLPIYGVNLLAYHDIGRDKYKRLAMEYAQESMARPSDERLEEIKQRFEANGFPVRIGG
jgi:pyruvate formate lyase activating enzyme